MPTEPIEHRVRQAALELAVLEWPGSEPAVLLVHATGFHAACWLGVARELAGIRMLAPDLRGHGHSAKLAPYGWDTFGKDLELLCEHFEMEGWVGVGHSLGGHALVQAAAARPQSFRSLGLVDPVILAPEAYRQLDTLAAAGEPHPASRRRGSFESATAMFERFKDRAPYARFRPEILRAYCERGLEPDPDRPGHYRLACPPEVEGAIYTESRRTGLEGVLDQIDVPVEVLRARPRSPDAQAFDFSTSPTWPALASKLRRGRDVPYPELTHFIPMEAPEVVAAHVRALREVPYPLP